ncbi:MAG: hypothetical protein WC405_19095 [Syntrophales bacterium]
MVFVGSVAPKYIDRGVLNNGLGAFTWSAGRKVPVRVVYYTGPGTSRYLSWQNIREKEVTVAADSRLELGPNSIHRILHPANNAEGALLINAGQLTKEAWGILPLAGDRLMSDLEKYCQWLVLLPRLDRQGREAFGFCLSMTGAKKAETNSFLSGFTDDIVALQDKLLFLNPYYKSDSYLAGDGFGLVREMSALVGRSVIRGVAAGFQTALSDEVVNYFAAAYTRLIATDFLDIMRVNNWLEYEDRRPLLKELDIQARALRQELSGREAILVENILKG